MQILIGSTDVTTKVVPSSLRIENILTKQVDRCTFTIMNAASLIFKPSVGQEVIIKNDDDVRIFGGVIVRRTDKADTIDLLEYDIECSDYTRVLDQKLVAETYQNMTVGDIIDDLILNFAPSGFTTNQVVCSTPVTYIQFKYESISSCLQQLADQVGYDWYVDYYQDLYFQSPTANSAPFDITDGDGTHIEGTLIIRRDNSQLRTSVIVRGGEYLGAEFTASVRADGKQITFPLPYKYTDFKATLTGHPLSIGVDYIDNPDAFDALYNFEEKILKFKESDRPSQNATLSFAGKPHLPVIVRRKNNIAIAQILAQEGFGDGEYEYLIVDKSINSQVAARERAEAEIRTYGTTLSEGDFETDLPGLKAGQRILVNSVARGINEYFIVNRVTTSIKLTDPTDFYYRVSLVTTKTMDYITIMKKLLQKDNKTIELRDDEQLNLSESASETITMNEAFTTQYLDYPVEWVLGGADYIPTGFKRVFVVGGGRLS